MTAITTLRAIEQFHYGAFVLAQISRTSLVHSCLINLISSPNKPFNCPAYILKTNDINLYPYLMSLSHPTY